jgi:hypothetical protein
VIELSRRVLAWLAFWYDFAGDRRCWQVVDDESGEDEDWVLGQRKDQIWRTVDRKFRMMSASGYSYGVLIVRLYRAGWVPVTYRGEVGCVTGGCSDISGEVIRLTVFG